MSSIKVKSKKENKEKEEYNYSYDCWDVLKSFYKQNNNKKIIDYQFLSFQQFIEKYIDDVFKQFNPIIIYNNYIQPLNKYQVKLEVEFLNYSIGNPIITTDYETINMTPQEARQRNLTYASELNVDIKFKRTIYSADKNKEELNLDIKHEKEIKINRVNLGKIPIMVQSNNCYLEKSNGIMNEQLGECRYDKGGYFIINGNEKVVIGQERIAENKIFAFRKTLSNKTVEYNVEIHSIIDNKFSIVMKNIVSLDAKNGIIYFEAPLFKEKINIFLIMKLLGAKTDKDMIESICFNVNDDVLGKPITTICNETMIDYKKILEHKNIKSHDDLIIYILKYIKYKPNITGYKMTLDDEKEYLYDGLEKKVLPHLRDNLINKLHFIGAMIRKMLKVKLKLIDFDKRDSFENKRIDTPGYLMAGLFRQCINRMIKDMTKNLSKELSTNYNINNSDIIYSKEYIAKSEIIENDNNLGTTEKKQKLGILKDKLKLTISEMIDIVYEKKDILETINSNNIYKIIKNNSIESGIKFALATGNWGIKTTGDNKIKVGVAQVLSRLSNPSYLSHLRRVISPSEKKKKSGKILGPRKQHNSQFGFICPAETPEGQAVGLVKNLALSASITMQLNPEPLIHWLTENVSKMPETNFTILENKTFVYVNGNIIGYTDKPNDIFNQFLQKRRLGKFHQHITVNWHHEHNDLFFFTNAGRLIRPVFTVNEKGNLNITKKHIDILKKNNYNWNYLVLPGLMAPNELAPESVIDFIDNEETNNCLIAINHDYLKTETKNLNKFTHCEIHPGLMLGVLACIIPFPDHNQSPRNAYQSSMGKQAMGNYATNFADKMDTHAYVMNYLERPLVRSHFGSFVNYDELPCGMNVMVAISCYTGYNQEDSIILNKGSLDNGLFVTTHYHVYKDEEKKIQSNGKEEKFCKPDIKYISDKRNNNYDKLDSRGFVRENTYVTDRDIIIGKQLPIKNKYIDGHQIYKDCSTSLKANESGYIDKVFVNRNEEGFLNCKIKIRDERIPTIGSKFASRVGQKGTVGMILNKEDMPFTKNGLVPDIIMTPHAIPSRMTVGQLIETLMGKLSANLGGFSYCTPFNNLEPEHVVKLLEEHGLTYCGDEVLYSGITGKQMNVKLYFGPTYYQRLKHMVEDKMHCLTTDHRILTNNGLKYYYELNNDDLIYTYNKDTKQNIYQKYNKVYFYANTDKSNASSNNRLFYVIKNKHMDMICTHEHNITYINNLGELVIKPASIILNSLLSESIKKIKMISLNDNNEINHFYLYKEDIEVKYFSQDVFCISLKNRCFYTERNGFTYLTGNSRNNGPVVLLTRQPAEGRSREGGLRIGEMETDAIQGHGAMNLLKERLMDVSDKFTVHICNTCGNYAVVNDNEELYICENCDQYNDFKKINIPYATKLLSQELQGIGINMKYMFDL